MLQNFTEVNNFPPQVSSCNPSVVSYVCMLLLFVLVSQKLQANLRLTLASSHCTILLLSLVLASMPVKMTASQKEAYHMQKMVESRLNNERNTIQAVLRLNDGAVTPVKRLLVSLELWPDEENGQIAVASTPITAIAKRAAARQKSQAAQPLLMITDGENAGITDPVPSRYWEMAGLSVTLLLVRVHKCSNTVLSMTNLRALITWGKGKDTRGVFLEILEFCTGWIDGEFKLTGEYRDFAKVDQTIVEACEKRPGRAAQLTLPPDWSKQGLLNIFKKALVFVVRVEGKG